MHVAIRLWQAYKVEFAAFAKINSGDSYHEGIYFSLAVLAAQFTPLLLSLPWVPLDGGIRFAACYAAALVAGVFGFVFFRAEIKDLIERTDEQTDVRSKVLLSVFFFISTGIFLELSRVSFWATALAYLALGFFPLLRLLEKVKQQKAKG